MKTKEQVQCLLDGFKFDLEVMEENYSNGVINIEQYSVINTYK